MAKGVGYGIFSFVDENEKTVPKAKYQTKKKILTYYIRRRSGRVLKVQGISG